MSVRIEKDGPVWTVIHSRPEARNAWTPKAPRHYLKHSSPLMQMKQQALLFFGAKAVLFVLAGI